MLLTIGGLIAAAVLMAIAWLNDSSWLRKFVSGAVAIWFAFYTAMLLGFSFASKEQDLGINQPKEFCGFYLDCHMHAAVSGVRKTKTLGSRTATGEFYIVSVKVFSDAVRATLGLTTVDAHVVDSAGREYTRDDKAETQLPRQPEFEQQIGPEESFTKEIVFDLPAEVQDPRLDISEGFAIDRLIEAFLIGDEDSIFHKRNYFKLVEHNLTASAK
jgi:hypothetical protein